jgi:hypothetical protein
MSLFKKLQKATVVEKSAAMDKSDFFNADDLISLPVPVMNLAYSGRLDGGFGPGMHLVCGPSKHFKSNLCLIAVKALLDKYPESFIIFYDSEFGSLPDYWRSQDIDVSRVLHVPVRNMEELKFDIMKKLEAYEEAQKDGDNTRIMIYVDSLGNLASKKEVDDAMKESSAADMTRAKVGKSLARMITPYLKTLKIPFFGIQHTYDTMEMYSKKVVSGGQGWILSSDSIFVMGKRQVKDGSELAGFEFVMNTDKSRCIKERSAIPITVTFSGGIDKFSGLLDIGLASGWVTKPKNGWYTRPSITDDRNWREKDTRSDEFWGPLLANKKFQDDVSALFKLTSPKSFVMDEQGNVVLEDGVKCDPKTGEVIEAKESTLLDSFLDDIDSLDDLVE